MARSRELFAQGKKPALVFLLNHQDNPQGALTASAKAARAPNLPSNFIPVTLEQFSNLGEWVSSLESQYQSWNPSDGKAFAPRLPTST
jgi:hypothetical protein